MLPKDNGLFRTLTMNIVLFVLYQFHIFHVIFNQVVTLLVGIPRTGKANLSFKNSDRCTPIALDDMHAIQE